MAPQIYPKNCKQECKNFRPIVGRERGYGRGPAWGGHGCGQGTRRRRMHGRGPDMVSKKLGSNDWKKVLNNNLKDMYSGNCWGVPSFKITDSNDENPFYVWGQDRMWLLKEEIYRRLNS